MTAALAGWQSPAQLLERQPIDVALEVDDLANRVPVGHPAPGVELRLGPSIEADMVLLAHQAQQKPLLLLTDTGGCFVAPDVAPWQLIFQPPLSLAQDLDMPRFQANLLVQFAKQRIARRFALVDAPLGKLPGVVAHPLGPEYAALGITDHDADIGTIAAGVNDIQGEGRPLRVWGWSHCSTVERLPPMAGRRAPP